MSSPFTEEQQIQIKEQLFHAGIKLSKVLGVQRMTVSKLAATVGIAKGSFYHFFESKEAFVLALSEYAGQKTNEMFLRKLSGRTQMTTHEFIEFFREYMHSEYDLMNGLTIEDAVWLKKHMPDADFFEPNALADVLQGYFKVISDVRESIDIGTVVNLIKGIYVMRESRETMIEASLDNSIELMLRTLEIYISGRGELFE